MSFLTSRLASSMRTSVTRATGSHPVVAASAFHTSSVRRALSESDHTDDHPDRAGKIEHHKQDQLSKQKQGKGHWSPELASNSEAAIKADRNEINGTQENIEKLQKEAEDLMQPKEIRH